MSFIMSFITVKDCSHITKFSPILLAATKLGQGNIFIGVCQDFCSRGGVSEIFGGGAEWGLKFSGGGVSEILGGLKFSGGGCSSKFFFLFFSISLSPKKSFWDAHPPPPGTCRDGQCAAGTHPTGMHSCLI